MVTQPKFLLDLDGTLTQVELLPKLAGAIGLGDEMAELTRLTMLGLMSFEASLRIRVQLLRDLKVDVATEIALQIPPRLQLLAWAQQHRNHVVVVTSNLDVWVTPLLARWGLSGRTSSAHLVDGRAVIEYGGILDKSAVVQELQKTGPVVAVGDGANDATMLQEADFGIAFCPRPDVSKMLIDAADCVIREEAILCRTLSRL
jgi:phosphoserine phosphatase